MIQKGANVYHVIVPDPWTTSRGADSDAGSIDIELISSVCSKVQISRSRAEVKLKFSRKLDNPSSRIDLRGIDPVRRPDPVGLERTNRLLKF